MSESVNIGQMADAIMRQLNDYSDALSEDIREAVDKTASEAVKELKATSPKNTGKYAKGWAKKKTDDIKASAGAMCVVYNKRPGLAHLLEHGHALKRGGRTIGRGFVQARKHIKPVEEAAKKRLEERIKGAI